MIGYGSENTEFVFELTYNYAVLDGYKLGNDFLCGELEMAPGALDKVRVSGYPIDADNGDHLQLRAPDGYPFVLRDGTNSRVRSIALGASNLSNSVNYWSGLLGMNVLEQNAQRARVTFNDVSGFVLELVQSSAAIDHATAPGRIAFSYPEEKQLALQEKMQKSEQGSIINTLIKLDTPGKATVQVVILGDVDGHQICFVGDAGYRQLSQFDPKADPLLNEAMSKDGSREYAAKKLAQK